MTEEEWLASKEPQAIIEHVRVEVSDRKLRLFACAWLRQVWPLLADERSRRAVEVAERHADGLATDAELTRACDAAAEVIQGVDGEARRRGGPTFEAACAAHWSAVAEAAEAADQQLLWNVAESQARLQAALLRDLIGNPFRPACIRAASRTPAVVTIAAGSYEERELPAGHLDPARLAVLADALEEAGCTDADLLAHLRSPGPHVRGCWALDLVLGKG